jgi:hypothetical protein
LVALGKGERGGANVVHAHRFGAVAAGLAFIGGGKGQKGRSRRVNLLHQSVAVIYNVDVPIRIQRHPRGVLREAAAHSGDAPSNVGGSTARRHHLHQAVLIIGNVDVAAGIHRQANGVLKEAAEKLRFAQGHAFTRAVICLICNTALAAEGKFKVTHRLFQHPLKARAQWFETGAGGMLPFTAKISVTVLASKSPTYIFPLPSTDTARGSLKKFPICTMQFVLLLVAQLCDISYTEW